MAAHRKALIGAVFAYGLYLYAVYQDPDVSKELYLQTLTTTSDQPQTLRPDFLAAVHTISILGNGMQLEGDLSAARVHTFLKFCAADGQKCDARKGLKLSQLTVGLHHAAWKLSLEPPKHGSEPGTWSVSAHVETGPIELVFDEPEPPDRLVMTESRGAQSWSGRRTARISTTSHPTEIMLLVDDTATAPILDNVAVVGLAGEIRGELDVRKQGLITCHLRSDAGLDGSSFEFLGSAEVPDPLTAECDAAALCIEHLSLTQSSGLAAKVNWKTPSQWLRLDGCKYLAVLGLKAAR
jgi:hypothetical protein